MAAVFGPGGKFPVPDRLPLSSFNQWGDGVVRGVLNIRVVQETFMPSRAPPAISPNRYRKNAPRGCSPKHESWGRIVHPKRDHISRNWPFWV